MKSGFEFLGLLICAWLLCVSCTSPEEKTRTEFNTNVFSVPDTTLLYEYTATSSSATGSCAGMFIDRWYGSELSYKSIVERYEKNLVAAKDWVLWPEDVARIWRKQTQNELFSVSIEALTSQDTSNPLGLYDLPASLLQTRRKYPTVYGISLRYLSKYGAEKCFKK
jgi:hypothetical protein